MGVPFLILNIITFLPSWTQTKLQMEADSKYIHIFFPIQSVFFFNFPDGDTAFSLIYT